MRPAITRPHEAHLDVYSRPPRVLVGSGQDYREVHVVRKGAKYLLEIPANVGTFDAFRRWVRSPRFPARGRIDFVANTIEIDMSPENLFHHGELKSEIHSVLYSLAKREQWGHVFVDCAGLATVDQTGGLVRHPVRELVR